MQTAVNEAQAGETVWIQDGFVCETGKQEAIGNGGFFPRIDIPNKVITVRSESGYVDLDLGKGATIRGEKDPDFAGTDKVPAGCGTNGIRPLRVRNAQTVVQGLILEDGYTGDAHNYGCGGAIYGGCIVSNCLIRNNHCYCGGAVGSDSARLYNCTITGNESFGAGYGGGAVFGLAHLYNCTVTDNRSSMPGGVVYCNSTSVSGTAVYSNCVFRNNSTKSSCAFVLTKVGGPCISIYDSEISGEIGVGVNGRFDLRRCTLHGFTERAVVGSEGNKVGTYPPVLTDCVVSSCSSTADGGAVSGCIARNTLFTNDTAMVSGKTGGAAVYSVLDGCRLVDCRSESSGGAVYSSSLTNCVIWNCTSFAGGGVAGSSVLHGTVVSNCYASGTGYGGGAITGNTSAYDSWFVNNSSVKSGGAIYRHSDTSTFAPVYSNCHFIANFDTSSAGAVYYNNNLARATFIDCEFRGNKSTEGGVGALRGLVYCRGCTFADNVSTNGSSNPKCGAVCANANDPTPEQMPILEDCIVSNNFALGDAGGLYGCIVRGGRIVGNTSTWNGGGAHTCILSDCEIVGNSTTNWVDEGNTERGKGGGLYSCTATNCVIAGNRTWARNLSASCGGGGAAYCNLYNCTVTNNWSAYRSAAIHNCGKAYACYNCLIADNYADGQPGGYTRGMIIEGENNNDMPPPEKTPHFYNCTIAGNIVNGSAGSIVNAAVLHNCIVWGNTTPNAELFPGQVTADHTCQKDLTPGTDDKNLNCNPKLTVDYRPGYPVKNKGLRYPWMVDENDVRSKDLAGGPRILGAAPDLGCYEPPIPGLMLLVK